MPISILSLPRELRLQINQYLLVVPSRIRLVAIRDSLAPPGQQWRIHYGAEQSSMTRRRTGTEYHAITRLRALRLLHRQVCTDAEEDFFHFNKFEIMVKERSGVCSLTGLIAYTSLYNQANVSRIHADAATAIQPRHIAMMEDIDIYAVTRQQRIFMMTNNREFLDDDLRLGHYFGIWLLDRNGTFYKVVKDVDSITESIAATSVMQLTWSNAALQELLEELRRSSSFILPFGPQN